MLLNAPVEEIMASFHADYKAGILSIDEYLAQRGVETAPMLSVAKLHYGGLYLIAAPSLNETALLHQLIADYRGVDFALYDPNRGKAGKRYYVPRAPASEAEEELKSFAADFQIISGLGR